MHIEGRIPDGIVREYCTGDRDGGTQILFAEWNYKNNELEGVSKIYYDDGLLEEEIDYTHGTIDLIVKKYYENGHLSFESSLKNFEGTTSLKEYSEENVPALV